MRPAIGLGPADDAAAGANAVIEPSDSLVEDADGAQSIIVEDLDHLSVLDRVLGRNGCRRSNHRRLDVRRRDLLILPRPVRRPSINDEQVRICHGVERDGLQRQMMNLARAFGGR